MSKHVSTTDVMEVISEITNCITEAEVHTLSKKVIETLDANWFVYTTILPPDKNSTEETARYFIGCKPELCPIYNQRMWVMNDPFLEYARTNTATTVGSKIKTLTTGQAEIMKICSENGFRSTLVVPTHTSMASNKRMGLLYVGSELEEVAGEPLLLKSRVQFGALGMELLLWWTNRLKQQAMRKFSLGEEEIYLLQLSKRGMVAQEIAAIFDVKTTAIYKKLNLIKDKLNVDKIEQAVIEAESMGILG